MCGVRKLRCLTNSFGNAIIILQNEIAHNRHIGVRRTFFMATSSINRNFVITDKKQIEAFAQAVERSSANKDTHSICVKAAKVSSADALKKIMDKRKRHGC